MLKSFFGPINFSTCTTLHRTNEKAMVMATKFRHHHCRSALYPFAFLKRATTLDGLCDVVNHSDKRYI